MCSPTWEPRSARRLRRSTPGHAAGPEPSLLGSHLIGPEVTELLPELTRAQMGAAAVAEKARNVHADPTLGHAVWEAIHGLAGCMINIQLLPDPSITTHSSNARSPRSWRSGTMTRTIFPVAAARRAVAAALAEDASGADITTTWSVPEQLAADAEIRARQAGIAAGLPVVAEVFAQIDPEVRVETVITDGARLAGGDVLVRLSGSARSLITAERTALNFLQRLCGIATLADRYVRAVAGTGARILDTRKTAPGLRALDKYAVMVGGGRNHRLHLAAMVLLKENHIAAAGGVTTAIGAVERGMTRSGQPVDIEVEVQTVAQAVEALDAGARWIMLDNMPVAGIEQVVRARAERADTVQVLLEASGTVGLDNVRAIADTGVDLISVGALTHSAPALDLTMLLATGPPSCPR
jgi:nicotinate-nucleotide pyrophosphorylase (carboxylating)